MSARQRITDQGVAGLPIAEGRAELLEEIMQSSTSTDRSYRGLLVPLAAAAAVVAVAGSAWALSAGEGPDTSPRSPGFGSGPSSPAENPSAESPSTESPSAESPSAESPSADTATETAENACILSYGGGPTPATDGPEFAHCDEVILQEQQPGDLVQQERYQRPPKPVLLTAEGWRVEGVYNMDLDWVGPGGREVHLTWVQTDSADPFAYDRYDRAGDRIDVLGVTGRLTGFVQEGQEYQVLLTSPVDDGGPGLLLETSTLGAAEFRALVGSLEWVDLEEYEAVVRAAVG
ncbi:hypothetical protein [Nocardioides bizhenqiangii]|uniref:Uncharacterized protein n=1 Tax=Nocardioides bizhenqiangii TaxID=3095076 RepID=A0ABZ0ZPR4_9ACTN|nr:MULTISPECIES: hypothetical protein [unclassified Nocardioides]MDZ5619927.1 hypothetical protein [Nocardioides sp. HM23]WQQ26070.1 hypothetical protein SHK19_19155 [Nocardioides sp. HM61]